MKKLFLSIFQPFYYLYQRKVSDKIINFLKKYPIFQFILAILISVGILYFSLFVYNE